ncbi:MAG: ABC-type transport system involved in multi-copper enzyme maturation permease subunit [Akkermansiaceae bacterium]|jgi:ABC-type transport system involved in multi-copper enzyme maturation permease subunit
MKTSSSEINRGAKIIAMSILCGCSLLAFVVSFIWKSEATMVFSALVGLLFFYFLIGQWFCIRPIRATLDWLAGYGSLENRMDAADEANPANSKNSV